MRLMATHAMHRCRCNPEVGLGKVITFHVMALFAERLNRLRQKFPLGSEMGLVAGSAIRLSGGVDLFFGEPFFDIIVARQAEIRPLGKQQLRQFSFMRAVAFTALTAYHGLMGALRALYPFTEIVMTGCTEFVLAFNDHAGKVAAVAGVTGLAIPGFERLMADTACSLFHHVVVALCTELGTGLLQELRCCRAVGTVTRGTFSSHDRAVRIAFLEFCLCLTMAAVADRVCPVRQHCGEIGTVGIVAAGALVFTEGRVDNSTLLGGHGFLVARPAEVGLFLVQQFFLKGAVRRVAG